MELLVLLGMIAIVCFIKHVSQPSIREILEKQVDPKGFFNGITVEQLILYQLAFNEISNQLPDIFHLSEAQDKESVQSIAREFIKSIAKEHNLDPMYLMVMLYQYFGADNGLRLIHQYKWVKIVTNVIKPSVSVDKFYPSAEEACVQITNEKGLILTRGAK